MGNITDAAPTLVDVPDKAALEALIRARWGKDSLIAGIEFLYYDPVAPSLAAHIHVNLSSDYYSYKDYTVRVGSWLAESVWRSTTFSRRFVDGCGVPSYQNCKCCANSGSSQSNSQQIDRENCCNFGCTQDNVPNGLPNGKDNQDCYSKNKKRINVYVKDTPKEASTANFDVIGIFQGIFLNLLGHIMLPVFLSSIVYEKEHKILSVMKMMGLRTNIYWMVNYVFDLSLFMFATFVTIGTGFAGGIRFFTQNGFLSYFLLYFAWGNAMISIAFFFSVLFTRNRPATIFGYMLVMVSVLVGNILLPGIVQDTTGAYNDLDLFYYSLYPPLAFGRGLFILADASILGKVAISDTVLFEPAGKKLLDIILYLFAEAGILFFLTFYLEAIIPRGYGVKKSPWFFLTPSYWADACSMGTDVEPEVVKQEDLEGGAFSKLLGGDHEVYDYSLEPFDVKAERERVYAGKTEVVSYAKAMELAGASSSSKNSKSKKKAKKTKKKKSKKGTKGKKGKHDDSDSDDSDHDDSDDSNEDDSDDDSDEGKSSKKGNKKERILVRCLNLRKVYPGSPPKTAVVNLTFGIQKGECFGMLGPNGAGKTTAISMLSGLFAPTSGTAFIHGYSIRTQMDRVHMVMGVCPQHDVLWLDQSPRDHLEFYGRLKNLVGSDLTDEVETQLKNVNLVDEADQPVKTFSGGMKRRLSVAISFMGNPQVVFLDEPTTGLDPRSRHDLWEVIRKAKKDKAIILTTHSMEEADYLCDRIGIVAKGALRCIGESAELKERYGAGYKFSVTTKSQDNEAEVDEFLEPLLPDLEELNNLGGTRNFEVPRKGVDLARVFSAIEKEKKRLGITDWGISNTTLEEVFIHISAQSEAEG
eukprot:TRINITY_DN874_c0_g2_i8.p1 TRINITY_DN874_c0_g2~~TRINITY_DN874_c0_g2_i8.p1  ORF type:complete len:866 (+),score=355.67 TRINITY_DN874_c0_g2_i8:567-3164(+)